MQKAKNNTASFYHNTWEDSLNLMTENIQSTIPKTAFADFLHDALKRMSDRQNQLDLLPLLVYSTFSANTSFVTPLMSAWQLLRYAAKNFDDAEDQSIGSPGLINLGTAFLFCAHQVLEELPPTNKTDIIRLFNLAGLSACSGQHLDLSAQAGNIQVDPDRWLEIAYQKSGALFSWACQAGALLAGAEKEVLEDYRFFGYHLGALVQATDDFEDVWRDKTSADHDNFRVSLPYVYAFHVTPPEKKQELMDLLHCSRDNISLHNQIQNMLINLGAQKFMLAVIYDLHTKTSSFLQKRLDHNQPLIEFTNRISPLFIP